MSQGSAELDGLSDLELQRLEIPARTTRARKQAFVPVFPLSVLGAVVEAGAEKALPLLLAIHRQLKMTEREWTPLNAAIWKAAGNPSAKKRAAIISILKKMPELVFIGPHRTTTTHYRVSKGPLWEMRAYDSLQSMGRNPAC